MGLTLHYSARLRRPGLLPALNEEIADICQSLKWPCQMCDEVFEVEAQYVPDEPGEGPVKAVRLQGVFFTPPECETFSLTFTPTGRLSSAMNLMAADIFSDPEWVYHVHVKTQFAGPDVHIALVKLLRYLENKYLDAVEVTDEGDYWETEDRARLEKNFATLTHFINVVGDALENYRGPMPEDGSPQSLADLIEKILREKLGRAGI